MSDISHTLRAGNHALIHRSGCSDKKAVKTNVWKNTWQDGRSFVRGSYAPEVSEFVIHSIRLMA
jgi:hypothetical protein